MKCLNCGAIVNIASDPECSVCGALIQDEVKVETQDKSSKGKKKKD